ncbi:unnamed protein product [Polarella glacialis]|uniref:Uncharacterized protein n=1 Tax=Polarella glacialis TaxID=89957 RepID=A0A813IF97_POLGL|nr:unnamed protein product [Polarella glacialis]
MEWNGSKGSSFVATVFQKGTDNCDFSASWQVLPATDKRHACFSQVPVKHWLVSSRCIVDAAVAILAFLGKEQKAHFRCQHWVKPRDPAFLGDGNLCIIPVQLI